MIRLAGMTRDSIVDGPGIRTTFYVQGCPHHCPGCHNPETWPFEGGREVEPEELVAVVKANPLCRGVTFSGGEPFLQPAPLVWLARAVHARGLDVLAFSGYTCEELFERGRRDPAVAELLDELDYLVDGPFVEALKDLELEFRGSSNQRFLTRGDIAGLKRQWLAGQGQS